MNTVRPRNAYYTFVDCVIAILTFIIVSVIITTVFYPYTYKGFTFIGNVKELYDESLNSTKVEYVLNSEFNFMWNENDMFYWCDSCSDGKYLKISCSGIEEGTIDESGRLHFYYTSGEETFRISADMISNEVEGDFGKLSKDDQKTCAFIIYRISDEYKLVYKNIYTAAREKIYGRCKKTAIATILVGLLVIGYIIISKKMGYKEEDTSFVDTSDQFNEDGSFFHE